MINDNSLSTADPASMPVIEQHMLGFLFSEGEFVKMPAGYSPPKRKK